MTCQQHGRRDHEGCIVSRSGGVILIMNRVVVIVLEKNGREFGKHDDNRVDDNSLDRVVVILDENSKGE